MTLSRREFLRSTAGGIAVFAGATGLITWTPRAHAVTRSISLYARSGMVTQVTGRQTYMFGFATGATLEVPGPLIVCMAGDTINITLTNTLGTQIAFVVPGLTSQTIPASGSKTFSITPTVPGTYMYQDNQNNGVNRVMGLHGVLVVMPSGVKNQSFSGAPTFKRQYKWVFNAIDAAWCDAVKQNGDNYVASGNLKTTNFVPGFFTLNGASYPNTHNDNTEVMGKYGEAALIRIVNANIGTHAPHFHGNHVKILSRNRQNFTSPKVKDIVATFNGDCVDVLFPMTVPPDAYPPVTTEEQHFPMHDHFEPTQTAAGGNYPKGLHGAMMLGHAPSVEPDLTQKVTVL